MISLEKMVIFYSYVKLPEGKSLDSRKSGWDLWKNQFRMDWFKGKITTPNVPTYCMFWNPLRMVFGGGSISGLITIIYSPENSWGKQKRG